MEIGEGGIWGLKRGRMGEKKLEGRVLDLEWCEGILDWTIRFHLEILV